MSLTANDILRIKDLLVVLGQKAVTIDREQLIIDLKADHSPVTHVDKIISASIVEALYKLTPNIPVVSEEEIIPQINGDTFWLVDPIDGTKSYIAGEDTYTINIGLIENGKPQYGFIYQPPTKLLYYTNISRQFCIELDGAPYVPVARDDHDIKAVIGTRGMDKNIKEFFAQNHVTQVEMVPSSVKLCMIAEGAADLYSNFGETMEWDIAAGHAIILASGGDVIDVRTGQSMQYLKNELRNNGFVAFGAGVGAPILSY